MTITGTNMNAAAVPYAKVATVVQTYTPVYASTAYNADTIKNQTGWLAATPETYASTAVSESVVDTGLA